MQPSEIILKVETALTNAQVYAEGQDCSFNIKVVSECFIGLRSMQRQQSILQLFSEELRTGELHALSVQAYSPDEWQAWQSRQKPISIEGR